VRIDFGEQTAYRPSRDQSSRTPGAESSSIRSVRAIDILHDQPPARRVHDAGGRRPTRLRTCEASIGPECQASGCSRQRRR
jgi:hypothetical protein